MTQGMGWPISRLRHLAFDNRLLVMQGSGYITSFADPRGVALLQEVTTLALCPIFGSFLSYSLSGITDPWEIEGQSSSEHFDDFGNCVQRRLASQGVFPTEAF